MHKLVNDGDVACVFLAVANNVDERDVCFYPKSHKLLVEKTGHLVRDNPVLDYYDASESSRFAGFGVDCTGRRAS